MDRWQVLWVILLLLLLACTVLLRFYILYSLLSFHGQLQPWTKVTFLGSDINRIYLIFCNSNIFYPEEERSVIISYWPSPQFAISILNNIVMKRSQSDESRLVLALHISYQPAPIQNPILNVSIRDQSRARYPSNPSSLRPEQLCPVQSIYYRD